MLSSQMYCSLNQFTESRFQPVSTVDILNRLSFSDQVLSKPQFIVPTVFYFQHFT
jgi:hypothetical protein